MILLGVLVVAVFISFLRWRMRESLLGHVPTREFVTLGRLVEIQCAMEAYRMTNAVWPPESEMPLFVRKLCKGIGDDVDTDGWGTKINLRVTTNRLEMVSAGPDMVFGNADDVTRSVAR